MNAVRIWYRTLQVASMSILLPAVCLWAAEPDPAQKTAVESITSQVIAAEVVWNEAGKVQKLAISNHDGTVRGKAGRKDAPGVKPETFTAVGKLTDLEAIAIEKQQLGDASYALLGKLTKLRDVRLQYLNADAGATKDAPLFINDLPLPLTVLEIKHCFSIQGGCMDKLKAQPELKKLEIDTGFATPDCVPFILKSPKLCNLQIHRTTIRDGDLEKLAKGLPELETLLLRPIGKDPQRLTGASLRHLKACPKLRHLILGMEWKALPYEGGLDALAAMPSLKQLNLAPSDIKGFGIDDPAVQQLHKARPDLMIMIGGKTLGGAPDQKPEQEDELWNWDKGVNTHG